MEITVKKLFDWIRKGFLFVLIVSILFGTGFFVYTKYFVQPTYRAQVKFYASGTLEDLSGTQSVYLADYYRDVAPQYVEFLNVNEFYEMVAKKLQEEGHATLTPKEVSSCVKISNIIEDTSSFYVVVETGNPALTYNVAMAVAELAPKQIENFENVGILEVLSNPVMPSAPSGPNVMRNAILGFLFGALLSAFLVVLKELTDNRIKTPDEITELFGLPIFGIVPDFNGGDKKGGRSA